MSIELQILAFHEQRKVSPQLPPDPRAGAGGELVSVLVVGLSHRTAPVEPARAGRAHRRRRRQAARRRRGQRARGRGGGAVDLQPGRGLRRRRQVPRRVAAGLGAAGPPAPVSTWTSSPRTSTCTTRTARWRTCSRSPAGWTRWSSARARSLGQIRVGAAHRAGGRHRRPVAQRARPAGPAGRQAGPHRDRHRPGRPVAGHRRPGRGGPGARAVGRRRGAGRRRRLDERAGRHRRSPSRAPAASWSPTAPSPAPSGSPGRRSVARPMPLGRPAGGAAPRPTSSSRAPAPLGQLLTADVVGRRGSAGPDAAAGAARPGAAPRRRPVPRTRSPA